MNLQDVKKMATGVKASLYGDGRPKTDSEEDAHVNGLFEYVAMERSILFAEFLERSRSAEKLFWSAVTLTDGMPTYRYATARNVYTAFLKELQHPDVLIKIGDRVETSSFEMNGKDRIPLSGHVYAVDYFDNAASVVYRESYFTRGVLKKLLHKFPLSELKPY